MGKIRELFTPAKIFSSVGLEARVHSIGGRTCGPKKYIMEKKKKNGGVEIYNGKKNYTMEKKKKMTQSTNEL